jgi:phospholipase/carboxylesterase
MQTSTFEAISIPTESTTKSCVILLHGLGADGNDFTPIVSQLNLPKHLGVRFVFPHAPVRPVSINGGYPMRAWFDVFGFDPSDPQDQQGIASADKALVDLIQQQCTSFNIPADKIILAGFSQGGALALYTGLRYPQRLAGIIGLSTFLPLHYSWQPQQTLANKDVPIFMAHGDHDTILPLALGEASKNQLTRLGFNIAWHTYPMAHSVCWQEITDLSKWLEQVLS